MALLLVGAFLFAVGGVLGRENAQIEGFIFGLLAGVVQMAVIHYLIAKLVGPLVFGRLWCGWACWTAMVLDLLPFSRSAGRLPGQWGYLRCAHVSASLALVLILVFGLGYRQGAAGPAAVIWFLAGNALYYGLGIGLAYARRDNRAFCKYVCPITAPLKLTSRLALLKVAGDAARCDHCGACERRFPMDVRVGDYVQTGARVLSAECILCQTCTTVCPHDALRLSFGLDMGGRELLRERAAPAPEEGA